MVADRLKFLDALRFILFHFEARQKLKERSQLHKILEQNTWIFGEEYHLWASDKELTTVLKAHRNMLDPELVIDDPVKIVNKTRGVVDLVLSRAQRRHRYNDLEHLVVELKAPKVKLNARPPLTCADLWMCPSPRDWRRHWRLLGIFASPQDAEDASDAGA